MKAQFIYEKFEEESDPIKDMGIGVLKVFVIGVDVVDEEWQITEGIDIVFAHSKKEAIKIWNNKKTTDWSNAELEMRYINELNMNEDYHHITNAAIE